MGFTSLKLRATREARGTMGSRQKAAVHGTIATPAPSQPVVATPAPAAVVSNGTNGAAASAALLLNGSSH